MFLNLLTFLIGLFLQGITGVSLIILLMYGFSKKTAPTEQTKEKRQPPQASSKIHLTQVPQTLSESHKQQSAVNN